MSIKEYHELPAQVFGGGGGGDALNEVGSESRGVKLDETTCSIQKGDGKKKLDHGHTFPNFSGTKGVDVA